MAFRVQIGMKGSVLLVQKFVCIKPVKPQEPVCLVEAVFPPERRGRVCSRQQGMGDDGNLGGEEDPFQAVPAIESLAELQDMVVRFR